MQDTPPLLPNALATPDHLKLARTLSSYLIDIIRSKPGTGGAEVAKRLEMLRAAVWPSSSDITPPSNEIVFKKALEGLSDEQQKQLLEAYAHMGHLYEIAGLAARENHFDLLRDQKNPIPGGAREFIMNPELSLDEAIKKLNKPVFEVVMTQHPTNTNSLPSMQAQRALAIAIDSKDEARVKEALAHYEKTPILHQVDGKEKNFTVRDETSIVLNSLANIYDDLPKIYGQFDRGFVEKSAGYDPLALNLNIRLGSWGSSGDKDGNNSVTAETTLEAIAMHSEAIVSRYARELSEGGLKNHAGLEGWRQKLLTADAELKANLADIGALREEGERMRKGEGGVIPEAHDAKFDALSKKLAAIRGGLNAKAFEADLSDVARKSAGDEKSAAVDMVRKVRLFGFNFAKIEYRETAEEYSRVVGALIPHYDELQPHSKLEVISEVLAHSDKPHKLFEAAKEHILAAAAKPYDKKSAWPIAYHSLKRMELARDHGSIIKDNVLAECGKLEGVGRHDPREVKAQGVANILEAMLLQQAAEKDGKRPLLGIVPLFEEPETMVNISGILKGAYDNKAYQNHLKLLADSQHDGKKTQQVQIAHSDNARRSGLQAARAYIHEAHKNVRAMNKINHIQTQFFEGGSISDAYRNGVRAISGSVDAFELHDFAKFTFQGGDLLNYFNTPGSNARLFARNIVHAADHKKSEGKNGSNPIIDDIAIAALKRTLKDYQTQDFTTDKMGMVLAALHYDEETKAGNRGSRAADRGEEPRKGLAFKAGAKVHLGALMPIKIDKVRTIAFSEAWQHAGIVPSWLGSKNLDKYLQEETLKMKERIADSSYSVSAWADPELKTFFDKVTDREPLTADQLQTFYRKSPTFKDAQDRTAFALAMTDPAALKKLETSFRDAEGEEKKSIMDYIGHIIDTYKAAAKTTYASFQGKPLREPRNIRNLMVESLPRLSPILVQKTDYRSFLQYARDEMREQGKLDAHMHGIIHNAGDVISHGRYLTADDPAYGAFVESQQKSGWLRG